MYNVYDCEKINQSQILIPLICIIRINGTEQKGLFIFEIQSNPIYRRSFKIFETKTIHFKCEEKGKNNICKYLFAD